ncbi:MAG: A/G-specific adenine glycosylase [Candidatus Poribacteria bacterium]|nr:MAG: A/G-specific adenine glycosylase [Candidatus Poribacteria bacterium]
MNKQTTPDDRIPWTQEQRTTFQRRLREWFLSVQRPLPWRETRDPYRILVSEVMLQQTQVATVIPYYERFLARFPTVQALAEATQEEVLQLWQGLGYYSRARNLHRAARTIVAEHNGQVPADPQALLQLPGVGRYTAGAVASIAFGRPVPLVDGNVARVLCRLFCVEGDPKSGAVQRRLWQIAEALVPEERPDLHNVGLMELGALVCTPEAPQCQQCPVAELCEAQRQGAVAHYPRPSPSPETLHLDEAAAWTTRNGQVLLIRRPESARWWSGLWELPRVRIKPGESPERAAERALRELCGLKAQAQSRLLTLRHTVTRHRITLTFVACATTIGEPETPPAGDRLQWVALDRLEELPMAAPQRRGIRRILKEQQLQLDVRVAQRGEE